MTVAVTLPSRTAALETIALVAAVVTATRRAVMMDAARSTAVMKDVVRRISAVPWLG